MDDGNYELMHLPYMDYFILKYMTGLKCESASLAEIKLSYELKHRKMSKGAYSHSLNRLNRMGLIFFTYDAGLKYLHFSSILTKKILKEIFENYELLCYQMEITKKKKKELRGEYYG